MQKTEKIFESFGIFFIAVIVIFIIILILAWPVMWLWNWLMPVIFGLPTITVWQSLGLMMLFNLLLPSRYCSKSK